MQESGTQHNSDVGRTKPYSKKTQVLLIRLKQKKERF